MNQDDHVIADRCQQPSLHCHNCPQWEGGESVAIASADVASTAEEPFNIA